MFDQLDFYLAMNDNYKGLAAFMQACQIKGAIKDLPYEGEEKLVYENRFMPFTKVPVPRYRLSLRTGPHHGILGVVLLNFTEFANHVLPVGLWKVKLINGI